MAKTDNLKDYLKDLHEGIKTKKPDASRNPQDFRREIESIQSGVSLDPLTNPATAEQILTGRETYDSNGNKVTGTMNDNGQINLTIDGITNDNVNIPEGYTSGGVVMLTSDIQNEVDTQEDLIDEIINIVDNKMVSPQDMLQARVDATNSCKYLFYAYEGDNVDFISGLDTSKVTDMRYMFKNCSNITTIPLLNTSNVTDMYYMFSSCQALTTIPLLNTSNVTTMRSMFYICRALTTIPLLDTSKVTNMSSMFGSCGVLTTIPLLDTSKVTNMSSMFYQCNSLTTIPQLDTSNVTNMDSMFGSCGVLTTIPLLNMINTTSAAGMFRSCYKLTNLTLKNIKVDLQIGSGTSYGHLLTLDSLLNTCKECINTGSSKTLTVGSANLEKLASVYVKLTGAAEEDESNPKLPMIQCESTDEGAMLITNYMALKNWTLA